MGNLDNQKGVATFSLHERGVAHIVLVLLLLAGIGAGVILVQKQTNISPKANNQSNYSKKPVSAPITPRPTRSPNPTGEHMVNICHTTASDKNHFTLINIDENALNEHVKHGDIYPVPENGCPK